MNYEKAKYFSTMKRVLSILTDIYIFMSQHLKRIGCKVFDAQSLEQLIEVEWKIEKVSELFVFHLL